MIQEETAVQQDFNSINKANVLEEVTVQFYRYEQALVSNDIVTLDQLFWDSEYTIRLGATENLYGLTAIKEFRKQRPSKGLMRTLQNTHITTYGDTMAITSTEFTRQGNPHIGRQMQTWLKIEGHWKIVAAHVSTMGTASYKT